MARPPRLAASLIRCRWLVSHDRKFGRTVGNGFWLIDKRKLLELEGPEAFFASAGASG